MAWLFMFVPILLILVVHFRNQRKAECLSRASNYWIAFYLIGYFLPIPLFVKGEDGWSTIWGYSFADFWQSLTYAVILATIGGLVLSIAASPRKKRILAMPGPAAARTRIGEAYAMRGKYRIRPLRIVAITAISLGSLYVGIQLVGGLLVLLASLGDRITLFAGLNAFFLPVNMLIGVCFAISASRVTGERVSALAEFSAVGVTLPALFLLGQKSNIFILLLGVAIIKLISRRNIQLRWIAVAAVVLANLLMLYEFVFREALIIGVDPERLTLSGWTTYLWTQVTLNFMQIQNLTVLVDALPGVFPYTMGDTYLAFFSVIIPQSLIGVKPLTAAGVHTLYFWPEIVARESTTMPTGLFGEAYLNFGLLGYIALCLLVGSLLKIVDRAYQSVKQMNSMQIVSVAAFGSTALHFIRGEFFPPFLILVGIFIGARASVGRPPRQRVVRRKRAVMPLTSSTSNQICEGRQFARRVDPR